MFSVFVIAGACICLAIAAVFVVIGTYNRLVTSSQVAENGFSQIEVQLKRRHDLIPGIVEATRAYLSHESETLEAVIQARQQATANLTSVAGKLRDPAAMQTLAASQDQLSGVMGRLSMVIESYPELKANETVAHLIEELTSTENRISYARQLYNDLATKFNIQRQMFPAILFSRSIGFGDDIVMLQFDDREIHQVPSIDLAPAIV